MKLLLLAYLENHPALPRSLLFHPWSLPPCEQQEKLENHSIIFIKYWILLREERKKESKRKPKVPALCLFRGSVKWGWMFKMKWS